jgi:hypothetical protein
MPNAVRSAMVLAAFASIANAGPPSQTDDPEPTDFRHYEIYFFAAGTQVRNGDSAAAGIDFNYGATPDLQLTAVFPLEREHERDVGASTGLGNIELAAKYRFMHQAEDGWDVAVFPRAFLPSGSSSVGADHFSLLVPVWLQKDFGSWSTFGGGGCVLNHGGGEARNFCVSGWALTRQIQEKLQIGAELVHSTADTRGGHASTGVGAGVRYDLTDHYHLMAYAGPGLQHAAENGEYSWYAAILLTL